MLDGKNQIRPRDDDQCFLHLKISQPTKKAGETNNNTTSKNFCLVWIELKLIIIFFLFCKFNAFNYTEISITLLVLLLFIDFLLNIKIQYGTWYVLVLKDSNKDFVSQYVFILLLFLLYFLCLIEERRVLEKT